MSSQVGGTTLLLLLSSKPRHLAACQDLEIVQVNIVTHAEMNMCFCCHDFVQSRLPLRFSTHVAFWAAVTTGLQLVHLL